jgi:hypothetical protein
MLFDEINSSNIQYGKLNNLWLVSVIAALSEKPFLIKRLFKNTENNKNIGLYKSKLHFKRLFPGIYKK